MPGVLLYLYLILLIPDICPNLYCSHKVYHRIRISNVVFFLSQIYVFIYEVNDNFLSQLISIQQFASFVEITNI